MKFRMLGRLATALLFVLGAAGAQAQSYPSHTVTLIVPFAVGGSTDIVARLVAQQLAGPLGVGVVVDNRTGAGGIVGWETAARAQPDGYTLLTTEMSYAIAAGLQPRLPFDPKKSFAQITTAVSVPHVLVINPAVPAKNVAELIALAKSKPGKLFYGSGGNGTNTHLGGELFKSLTGVDMVHVPYKGAGAVLADLMSGQVQVLITSTPTALPYIRSGKLRALMVASEERMAVLPDVPSAKEVGLPGMEMLFWIGFAAPAGTPRAVIDRLNKEINGSMATPEAKQRLASMGLNAVANTPEQSTKLVSDEIARWTAVIKKAGIKAD
ncbi:MAG TPA: tripartite tricarboxylate transporter substrate binding protein [Burkholderiales bacterium]